MEWGNTCLAQKAQIGIFDLTETRDLIRRARGGGAMGGAMGGARRAHFFLKKVMITGRRMHG